MIKKSFKKVTAAVVGMTGLAMSCMLASAGYVHEIGWSQDPCQRCGAETSIWIRDVYEDPEETNNKQDCPHYTHGYDVQMVRSGTREFECQECGFSWSYDISNYYWECKGKGSVIID